MLKTVHPLKIDPVDRIDSDRGAQALLDLLQQVPAIKLLQVAREPQDHGHAADFEVHIAIAGRRQVLVCKVGDARQPRHVRTALMELRDHVSARKKNTSAIMIAPYLSPDAQALCRKEGVAFIDLYGNACLMFDSVFIERQVAAKPAATRRELRSLFKPKSARVLQTLLRAPDQPWRVTDLAHAAGVSLGHVSNVRTALLDREWARVSKDGLSLATPGALLDAWRAAYEAPLATRLGFYTILHGGALEDAARRTLPGGAADGMAVLASFSAAHWLAPYGRTGMHYFYADETGLERLRSGLQLSPMSKGENVMVLLLKDANSLLDTVEPAPGAICTGPIQTYLDLAKAGERGREAADHLRQALMPWPD